jgi:hypothetical protein
MFFQGILKIMLSHKIKHSRIGPQNERATMLDFENHVETKNQTLPSTK